MDYFYFKKNMQSLNAINIDDVGYNKHLIRSVIVKQTVRLS